MYNDILFNGSRRFVVPMCDPHAQGHFSRYARVFYLDDLKEVSEQANDQVKYVCSHTCVSVVRIERVVNDTVWGDRSSYLKGVCVEIEGYGKEGEEGATIVDATDDGNLADEEAMLVEKFTRIVKMQQELDEPVRFREELVKELSAKNKKEDFGESSSYGNRCSQIEWIQRNRVTKRRPGAASKVYEVSRTGIR